MAMTTCESGCSLQDSALAIRAHRRRGSVHASFLLWKLLVYRPIFAHASLGYCTARRVSSCLLLVKVRFRPFKEHMCEVQTQHRGGRAKTRRAQNGSRVANMMVGSVSSCYKKRSKTKVASPTIGERRHRSIADARSTGSAMARRAWSRPRASMPHRPAARARPTRPTTSTSTLSSGADTTKKTAAAPRLDPEASALLPTNRRTPGHVWSALIARALSA